MNGIVRHTLRTGLPMDTLLCLTQSNSQTCQYHEQVFPVFYSLPHFSALLYTFLHSLCHSPLSWNTFQTAVSTFISDCLDVLRTPLQADQNYPLFRLRWNRAIMLIGMIRQWQITVFITSPLRTRGRVLWSQTATRQEKTYLPDYAAWPDFGYHAHHNKSTHFWKPSRANPAVPFSL